MNKYGFNVAWSEEDQGYIAICPEFPGLSAFGVSREEALTEAQSALALFIKTYQEDGRPLPEPQTVQEYSGQFRLRLSSEHHRQSALAAAYEGISLNQWTANAVAVALGASSHHNKLIVEFRQMMQEMEGRLVKQTVTNNRDLALNLVKAWEQPTYNAFGETASNSMDATKYVIKRETETVEVINGGRK
jgi:predicted RNase H-like HicB family nuclease